MKTQISSSFVLCYFRTLHQRQRDLEGTDRGYLKVVFWHLRGGTGGGGEVIIKKTNTDMTTGLPADIGNGRNAETKKCELLYRKVVLPHCYGPYLEENLKTNKTHSCCM